MKFILQLCLLVLCCAIPSYGQKAYIGYIYPAAVQKGGERIIHIGGQGISSCKDILISGEGIKAEILPPEPTAAPAQNKGKGKKIITDEDNLQIANMVRVRLTLAPDAVLGMRDVKLVTDQGAISNRLYLEIVDYPCIVEKEPNGTIPEATPIPSLPVIVNGQVERGGRDCYTFSATQGQMIIAEVHARKFVPFLADAVPGWFQSVLALYDEQGREVSYCDDYKLSPDPVIIYKIPQDGKYTVEIKDSIYRGREDFVYRIAIGEIPFVTSIFPMGGQAGSHVKVRLRGYHLNKSEVERQLPKSEQVAEVRFQGKGGQHKSNGVSFEVGDSKEMILYQDNGDSRENAILWSKAEVINGIIEHEYDQDWFALDLKGGEHRIFEVMARRLGSPIDAQLSIFNEKGELLELVDDTEDDTQGMITHHADPQLSFKCPMDGRYYLRLRDTQNKYGPDFTYRLSSYLSAPSFTVNIEPSAITVPQGGTGMFTVFIKRYNGFRGNIDVDVKGLPTGFKIHNAGLPLWASEYVMNVIAPDNAKMGKITPHVVAKGTHTPNPKDRKTASSSLYETITLEAQPVEAMLQAFYITHYLPSKEFRIDVTEPQPFQLEVYSGTEPLQLIPDEPLNIKIGIKRQKGFNEPIQLMFKSLPFWAKYSAVTVEPDQNEVIIPIVCNTWKKEGAPLSPYVVATVNASTKSGKGKSRGNISASVMVISPSIPLVSPKEKPPTFAELTAKLEKMEQLEKEKQKQNAEKTESTEKAENADKK